MTSNPIFQNLKKERLPRGFYKTWYLNLIDPSSQRALWLLFTIFSSRNGFKQVAETWAVYFQKNPNRDIRKIAVKQSYDIRSFSNLSDSGVQIGDCILSQNQTKGSILSKGNSIEWDLSLVSEQKISFNLVPELLSKVGLIKNSMNTQREEILSSGTIRIQGEVIDWKNAVGMQGIVDGPKYVHSWVYGHCNTFVNELGKPASFIYEGVNARTQIGPFITPKISSFFFRYQEKNYYFNTLRDILHLKSKNTLNEWQFQADRGEISFRGFVRAEHKDFAGLNYEDTNGSLLYCASSKLSEMRILVYNKGKLEATFLAHGTASFEVVSRNKNPYVPILL